MFNTINGVADLSSSVADLWDGVLDLFIGWILVDAFIIEPRKERARWRRFARRRSEREKRLARRRSERKKPVYPQTVLDTMNRPPQVPEGVRLYRVRPSGGTPQLGIGQSYGIQQRAESRHRD